MISIHDAVTSVDGLYRAAADHDCDIIFTIFPLSMQYEYQLNKTYMTNENYCLLGCEYICFPLFQRKCNDFIKVLYCIC